MKFLSIPILLTMMCNAPTFGMVGKLPVDLQNQNDNLFWSIDLIGTMSQDVVDQLNSYAPVTIILDQRLARIKLAKFKMNDLTITQAAEKLCGLIDAKVYVQGTKLYISKTAPDGAGKEDKGKKAGDKKVDGRKAGGKANGDNPKVVQPPTPPKNFVPGTDTTYRWDARDYTACAKSKKSILLYVYDPYLKERNTFAVQLEAQLLRAPKVRSALKNFLMARAPTTSKSWPASFTAKGKKGAVIYVMNMNGKTFGQWTHRTPPTMDKIIQAATRAEKSTQKQRALKDKFKPVDRNKKNKAEEHKKKQGGGILGINKEITPKKPNQADELKEEEEE